VSSNAFVSIANVAELSIALSFDAVNHRDIFGAANFPTSGALSVVFIGTDFDWIRVAFVPPSDCQLKKLVLGFPLALLYQSFLEALTMVCLH